MSFARQLISGRGRTVTFDEMDRAAELSERVEDSQPMWKWVRENNKQPKYFYDWPTVIQEYHKAVGTPWTKDYSVPTPYGHMGYDTIKPPKVEVPAIKSGLITFPCEEEDDEKNLDWILDMMESDSDSDEDEESDFSDDEKEEDVQPPSNEFPADNEVKFDVTSNLFDRSPSDQKVGESYSDDELSLISESEDESPLMDCIYKCGGIAIDPECLQDGELNLTDMGGGYAHCQCHESAEKKGLTLTQIPKGTNMRDLPEGIRLEDLPRGAVITINESDIEWGSDIEISDDEDDSNIEKLTKAIAENKVAVRKCKCGSSTHRRSSHSSCPLNKKNNA